MHFKIEIAAIADAGLQQQLSARIDAKTKPPGSLGQLENIAIQLGLIQGSSTPRIVAPHLLVFAADHGVTEEGVSAYPQEVTWQMVMNYLARGAAVNVFASTAGLALKVVDAGVKHAFEAHPDLVDRKIAYGTRNLAREAAMSMVQAEEAIAAGAALARELAATGTNVIAFGEMGIGNTSAASALMTRLTGLPLGSCIGRGTGLDDSGLARKREVIESALALHAGARAPLDALAALGGFEIAMICGAMLAAAEARMVIMVDGFIVGSALLVAQALAPNVLDYCIFAHASSEQGHAAMLRHFNARPLLDLGLRLGEGTGAALAFPLVKAAAAFLESMASFSQAGVAGRM